MSTDTTNRQPKGIPTGGQFVPTSHTEPDLHLDPVKSSPEGTCSECDETVEDFQSEPGLCEGCNSEHTCRECGNRNDLGGYGYDGLCINCADKEFDDEEDEDSDVVCVFDHEGASIQVDHCGEDNYALYDEETNEHLADFEFVGDPEDHSELEEEAIQALRVVRTAHRSV
ncbi:hypothetical protein IV500_05255 [Paeniglutamicibacter antarcticus]|uniref:Uncharacterized protein n=1 Tax=Arthrobacter terrae TaxID=2935737 RepID=A0A931CKV9_9MICC|nr:hypothetical protein [Arthrobacter terrae]MBG0738827.1 hypothetical protein [Arthrobacter terrae]